jgi:carboxylesterase
MKRQRVHRHRSHHIRNISFSVGILFIILVIALFFPPRFPKYASLLPFAQYDDSVGVISSSIANEPADVNPTCNPILLTHGEKTEHVIVFFHGFTSCPGQFLELGERFYDLGYNVYIPRAPFHGLKDKRTFALDNLTAEKYTAYAERAVSVAGGLGTHVTVMGISGGGVLASWIAVHDHTLYKAVAIAPSYGFKEIPQWVVNPFIHIMRLLPSQYRWYDERKIGKSDDPGNGYHGFTTHSLVEILIVGQAVGRQLLSGNVRAQHFLLVSNANDLVVDINYIRNIQTKLGSSSHTSGRVLFFEFDRELGMGHDIIDTNVNQQQRQLVLDTLMLRIGSN